MIMIRLLTLLAFVASLGGCSFTKKNLTITHDGNDEIIKTAISDFLTKRKLVSDGDVFSVVVHDSIYRMVLKETAEGDEKWRLGQFYPNLIVVDIVVDEGKFVYSDSLFEDRKLVGFPNQYLEVDGKLFHWTDGVTYPTQKLVTVLSTYDLLLSDDLEGAIDFYEVSINDNQKGVHYFYCRGETIPFKKVVTNKALGFYAMPKAPCNR